MADYSREAAWALLNEHTRSASLLKHALAVEACVRAYGEAEADRSRVVGNGARGAARNLFLHSTVT